MFHTDIAVVTLIYITFAINVILVVFTIVYHFKYMPSVFRRIEVIEKRVGVTIIPKKKLHWWKGV